MMLCSGGASDLDEWAGFFVQGSSRPGWAGSRDRVVVHSVHRDDCSARQ